MINQILKYSPFNLFIIGLAFLFGSLFRVIYPGNLTFGFDQVQILDHAAAIASGDITLIGPRTGPAQMFTGPLIYYVTVPFLLLTHDFWTMVIVPLFFSLLTGVVLFLVVRRYIGQKEAKVLLFFWAFSPFIVNLDRIFWNPNLSILAATLLFFPLIKTAEQKKKIELIDVLALFLGAFLSFQAHFSGLLLVGLSLLSVVFVRPPMKVGALLGGVMVAGLVLSLLPIAIFDLRNDFLNVRGFLSLMENGGGGNVLHLVKDTFSNLYILAETTGKVFLYGNSTATIVTIGAIILLCGLRMHREKTARLAYLWIFFIAGAYAFYSGPKPEYYFLIALPALLYVIVRLLTQLNRQSAYLILVLFLASALYTNITLYESNSGLTLGNLHKVKDMLEQWTVKEIVYDIPFGSGDGLSYVLRNINMHPEGGSVHIVYPNDLTYGDMRRVEDVGIWFDPRKPGLNYLTQKGYLLETQPETHILVNQYPKPSSLDYDEYMIVQQDAIVGTLSVSSDELNQLDWMQRCQHERHGGWVELSPNKYLKHFSTYCLYLETQDLQTKLIEEIRMY